MRKERRKVKHIKMDLARSYSGRFLRESRIQLYIHNQDLYLHDRESVSLWFCAFRRAAVYIGVRSGGSRRKMINNFLQQFSH